MGKSRTRVGNKKYCMLKVLRFNLPTSIFQFRIGFPWAEYESDTLNIFTKDP